MRFSQLEFLYLLPLVPLLFFWSLAAERSLKTIQRGFVVSGERGGGIGRMRFRLLGQEMALLTLILALAGPEVSVLRPETLENRLAIAIGLDISKSMLAEDVVVPGDPEKHFAVSNRLNLGTYFADELLTRLKREQAGLFFFAGESMEAVSLTRDYGFLRYLLRHNDIAQLTVSGSDLGAAIQAGAAMLDQAGEASVGRMVLITDGEDTDTDNAQLLQALKSLGRSVSPVYAIGVGKQEPALIPVRKKGFSEISGFYLDQRGEPLQTELQEKSLRTITADTGGEYFHLDQHNVADVADAVLMAMDKAGAETTAPPGVHPVWLNLRSLFVAMGLLLYTGYLLT